jgi:hypothetical protein
MNAWEKITMTSKKVKRLTMSSFTLILVIFINLDKNIFNAKQYLKHDCTVFCISGFESNRHFTKMMMVMVRDIPSPTNVTSSMIRAFSDFNCKNTPGKIS